MILEYQNIHSIHDLKISAVNHLSLSACSTIHAHAYSRTRPTQQISKQNTPHITHPLLPLKSTHTHLSQRTTLCCFCNA